LQNSDPEVRFYAAEALAYLDEADAAPLLEVAARESSAFRWHALTALASMNHPAAYSALSNLLHVTSTETRYGAFHALRLHNEADPATKGELLMGPDKLGKFFYHLVPTTAEPLVHVRRTKHPEVVLFGHEQTIKPPQFLYAGKYILLKGTPDGQIKVSRFKPQEADAAEVCTTSLDHVIRTVVGLGASYADVIAMLTEAQKQNLLSAKFAIEAVAQQGRKYYRDDAEATESATGDQAAALPQADVSVATPEPELFIDRLGQGQDEDKERESTETYIDPEYLKKDKGILNKLNPWSEK
jgi:HEAT repeats